MRTNLKVPFAEKDQAKQLGARWDPARKLWYVENKADMAPFARWLPSGSTAPASGVTTPKASAGEQSSSEGIVVVGSRYVEHPRVCDCLPWEVCELCRATALNSNDAAVRLAQ